MTNETLIYGFEILFVDRLILKIHYILFFPLNISSPDMVHFYPTDKIIFKGKKWHVYAKI
jgi:hypothetical protein